MDIKNILLTSSILFFGLFLVNPAFASQHNTGNSNQEPSLKESIEGQYKAGSGFKEGVEPADPRSVIAQIIKIALQITGTVFLVLFLMGGYWLLTSRGRSEQVDKAKKTMLRATIGLIIILMAYSITVWVTGGVQQAAGLKEAEEEETTQWRPF